MPPPLSPWAFFGSLDNIPIAFPPKPVPKPTPTPLTYGTILHLFPTGHAAWAEAHNAAIASSQATIKTLRTRISYLADLKRTYSAEVDFRKVLIARPQGVPEKLFVNWKEWSYYFGHLEELVGAAQKHVVWLELMEEEYERAKLLWEEFWMLDEEIEMDEASTESESGTEDSCGDEGERNEEKANEEKVDKENVDQEKNEGEVDKGTANEAESDKTTGVTASRDRANDNEYHDQIEERLQDLLAKLNVHNTRKDFLHNKIIEGNNSERMRMFYGEGEPEWIQWPPADNIGGAKA